DLPVTYTWPTKMFRGCSRGFQNRLALCGWGDLAWAAGGVAAGWKGGHASRRVSGAAKKPGPGRAGERTEEVAPASPAPSPEKTASSRPMLGGHDPSCPI